MEHKARVMHVPSNLIICNEEKAVTLLLQHVHTIIRDADVVIDSPDTHVFLLMVIIYPSLPVTTTFLIGKGQLKIQNSVQPIYNMLGPKGASAIFGFHAFIHGMTCVLDLPAKPIYSSARLRSNDLEKC